MILEIIHNCKMLTSFKVKILPLHISIENSVLGRLEARNGTGSIRKEANIQRPVRVTWRGRKEVGPQPDKHVSDANARCPCPRHWTWAVSAVPPSLQMTSEEDKPRKLASNCRFFGHNSATSTKLSTFCLPNFPHSISNGAGLYPYFPKWLWSSTSQYTVAWIQSQISVCD